MAALRKFSGASRFAVLNMGHLAAECGIWYQHRLDTLFSRKKNTNAGKIKSETTSNKSDVYRMSAIDF